MKSDHAEKNRETAGIDIQGQTLAQKKGHHQRKELQLISPPNKNNKRDSLPKAEIHLYVSDENEKILLRLKFSHGPFILEIH